MVKRPAYKAEVTLEYPDECDTARFSASGGSEARVDDSGVVLILDQRDDAEGAKSARIHLDFSLIAETLLELARAASSKPLGDGEQREALNKAAEALQRALSSSGEFQRSSDQTQSSSEMSAREEVRLLHILE
jgi:hypothetical protein